MCFFLIEPFFDVTDFVRQPYIHGAWSILQYASLKKLTYLTTQTPRIRTRALVLLPYTIVLFTTTSAVSQAASQYYLLLTHSGGFTIPCMGS